MNKTAGDLLTCGLTVVKMVEIQDFGIVIHKAIDLIVFMLHNMGHITAIIWQLDFVSFLELLDYSDAPSPAGGNKVSCFEVFKNMVSSLSISTLCRQDCKMLQRSIPLGCIFQHQS